MEVVVHGQGATMFSDEELRGIANIERGPNHIEVMCLGRSSDYGELPGKLKIFPHGKLEIKERPEEVKGTLRPRQAIHRDEFVLCSQCGKDRRFRLRTAEECRAFHDALAKVNWTCSDTPITCEDPEERQSRKVRRGCPESARCSGCVSCVCVGCGMCRFKVQIKADYTTCTNYKSPCYYQQLKCPGECPSIYPADPHPKVCYLNCNSPVCQPECKNKKPNCNTPGAACLDPRFIGADGTVFYFHGKRNKHFTLVSDLNLQMNARFIGRRPAGRPRDNTWIQALGILFGSCSFSVEAIKAETWEDEIDHLKFSYNGKELVIPETYPSLWVSAQNDLKVERTSRKNSVLVTLPEVAEISVNVVPVTKEDDRIHNYQIPSDDCFAHLEVQFKFYGLSTKVEGVLGRTYQPDFKNPAKPGVAMPVVGGENKYRTTSLLSADCDSCVFSPVGFHSQDESLARDVVQIVELFAGNE
ncbi:hypothetical protein RHGRI_018482 [Rhododendron griersonianum]|uniref:Uncharacterized protein n=1 Tax=Rhododendron griersonianum TaxID=479676 RepID=A0AAV6K1Q1_9ERIC|nr:hypothetical protein RHGRI_018482 [Rhododendron griersonianum]